MSGRVIKKILAVRNDRFGEFLLNIPSFRALKETYKQAKLIIVVDPYTKELAKNVPCADEVIEWDGKKHTLIQKVRFIIFLKKLNIDMAIMLNPSKAFNIFTYFAGIPIRVGYDRKCSFFLTHKIKDRKHLGIKHEVEYNLDLVSIIGARTKDKSLSLSIDKNLAEKIFKSFNIQAQERLVAIHPFTSDPVKQWAPESFRKIARILAQDYKVKVLIIGGKDEYSKAELYFKNLGANLLNLTGKTSLIDLAAILKNCKLLISGDSGPVHLACSVGTPVIAIFRDDLPGKTAKRWRPWGEGSLVLEKDKLYKISAEEVLDKVKERLQL